jgi:RimJ/RimL family protein N-acetyltransferase
VTVRLSDGVVLLRPFHESDVDIYVARQDGAMADGFEWDGPATIDDVAAACARWTESWRTNGPERNFAIVDAPSDEVIGDCEVEARPDGYVNVTYVVFGRWRGNGVATRAARLLLAYAATEFPDHTPLFRVHPENAASLAVARSCGAMPSGREESPKGRDLVGRAVEATPR